MSSGLFQVAEMANHLEVVQSHHRFEGVCYRGTALDLRHLDAFALKVDPGLGVEIDVVILFSCHCFSISFKRDGRGEALVPADEVFDNGRERRVLCLKRYEHSKILPRVIKELGARTIQVAATDRQNFVTFEVLDEAEGKKHRYAVYFEVTKDKKRKKRLILHVQSAYVPDQVTKRQEIAGKVSFTVLLRKAYLGEKIRG